MSRDQRKFLNIQLAVSAVLNAVFSAGFVVLLFGGMEQVGLWGMDGLAFDLVPTTFMITFITTLVLTIVTRNAAHQGLTPLPEPHRLPSSVLLRAAALGAGAVILLVPPMVLVLWLVWNGDWSYGSVMVFKIIYGVALGFVVIPTVVRAALADKRAGGTAA